MHVTGPSQEALWRRASGKWDAADIAATEAAAATARVRILQQVGSSLYAVPRTVHSSRAVGIACVPCLVLPCPAGDTSSTLLCMRDVSHCPQVDISDAPLNMC